MIEISRSKRIKIIITLRFYFMVYKFFHLDEQLELEFTLFSHLADRTRKNGCKNNFKIQKL